MFVCRTTHKTQGSLSWQQSTGALVFGSSRLGDFSPATRRQVRLTPMFSTTCCRLLRSYDYICLLNSMLFSTVIIKAFYSNWATYQRVQAVWYLTQAVVQLLFMHFKGDTYQRYRFQVGSLLHWLLLP